MLNVGMTFPWVEIVARTSTIKEYISCDARSPKFLEVALAGSS